MRRIRFLPVFVLFVIVPGWALAEGKEGDADPAVLAANIRAALPAPHPAARLGYKGDLTLDGLWAGEVSYAATPKKFSGENLWAVTETVFLDVGGAELHYKTSYYLQQDLTLRSGSSECRHRGTKVTTFFSRKGDGYTLHRTVKRPHGKGARGVVKIDVGPRPTYGRVAVLLFLRGLAKEAVKGQRLDLNWFPLWEYTTRPAMGQQHPGGTGDTEKGTKTMTLVIGEGKSATAKPKRPAHLVIDAKRGKLAVEILVDKGSRALLAVAAPKGSLSVVPRGEAGKRIATNEEKPAKTWQQAFLKFGYGYHMARPKLIEEAFHWPSMYAYETKVSKSWDPAHPVEDFKAAWIKEFVNQSLHRTRQATERLLSMTLSTGKPQEKGKDEIVFAAHANFGGGVQRTYHLKRVDGLWYLWRVDF